MDEQAIFITNRDDVFYAQWQLCYGNVMQEMAEISIKRERFLFPRNFSANSHREAIK